MSDQLNSSSVRTVTDSRLKKRRSRGFTPEPYALARMLGLVAWIMLLLGIVWLVVWLTSTRSTSLGGTSAVVLISAGWWILPSWGVLLACPTAVRWRADHSADT